MIDLDELERLAKAATPGPWEQGNREFDPSIIRTSYPITEKIIGDIIIGGGGVRRDTKGRLYIIDTSGSQWQDNAAYIVGACNAVPELIERIRELEAENADLRRELKALMERH